MSRFQIPEGCVAEFKHKQFEKPIVVLLPNGHEITPRGYTYCLLKRESGVALAEAVCWCRNTDQFNKNIGRQISLGRAVKRWYMGKPFIGYLSKLVEDAD